MADEPTQPGAPSAPTDPRKAAGDAGVVVVVAGARRAPGAIAIATAMAAAS